jgi:hypothetical protein
MSDDTKQEGAGAVKTTVIWSLVVLVLQQLVANQAEITAFVLNLVPDALDVVAAQGVALVYAILIFFVGPQAKPGAAKGVWK